MMMRRECITLLGGAAAAWPFAARAQQAMPVIGFLDSRSPRDAEAGAGAFRAGLKESGYVDQQNVSIEYRWAEGRYDQLSAMAADLIRRKVSVIFAAGPPAAPAVKALTATIPIVFNIGLDPVQAGLVASLNRPGGNATGNYLFSSTVEPKKLELLYEVVPKVAVMGAMVNPRSPNAEAVAEDLRLAAKARGLQLHLVDASTDDGIDAAFVNLTHRKVSALVVGNDPYFTSQRSRFVALSARHSLPAIYSLREWVADGGLMSYGTNINDAYRQGGVYAGRILKGEKPADLPVMRPTKFELAINLKTAKTLGLTIPPTILVAADEVIE